MPRSTKAGRCRRSIDVADADAAVILYTSGTTADPKGVVLTHAQSRSPSATAAFAIVDVTESGRGPRRAAAVSCARADGESAAAARRRRARRVSRDRQLDRAAARAADARHHDLRVRAAVLLSDPPARHGRGRASAARSRARCSAHARAPTSWLRDRARLESRAARCSGACIARSGPKMRLLITGGSQFDPAIGARPLRPGLHVLNAYGLTETSGRRDDRAARRSLRTLGRPGVSGVEIAHPERRETRRDRDRATAKS